jgi:hypothetical protein
MCGSVVSRRQPPLNATKTLTEADETGRYKDTEKQLSVCDGLHSEISFI